MFGQVTYKHLRVRFDGLVHRRFTGTVGFVIRHFGDRRFEIDLEGSIRAFALALLDQVVLKFCQDAKRKVPRLDCNIGSALRCAGLLSFPEIISAAMLSSSGSGVAVRKRSSSGAKSKNLSACSTATYACANSSHVTGMAPSVVSARSIGTIPPNLENLSTAVVRQRQDVGADCLGHFVGGHALRIVEQVGVSVRRRRRCVAKHGANQRQR